MLTEFQKKMKETKDKAQEGLSEFQKKMNEKREIEFARTTVKNNRDNRGRIRQTALKLDLASNTPGYYYSQQRMRFN